MYQDTLSVGVADVCISWEVAAMRFHRMGKQKQVSGACNSRQLKSRASTHSPNARRAMMEDRKYRVKGLLPIPRPVVRLVRDY